MTKTKNNNQTNKNNKNNKNNNFNDLSLNGIKMNIYTDQSNNILNKILLNMDSPFLKQRIKKTTISVKNIFFPDKFIGHMKPEEQYEEIKMDTNSIVQKISSLYDDKIIEMKNFNFKKNK